MARQYLSPSDSLDFNCFDLALCNEDIDARGGDYLESQQKRALERECHYKLNYNDTMEVRTDSPYHDIRYVTSYRSSSSYCDATANVRLGPVNDGRHSLQSAMVMNPYMRRIEGGQMHRPLCVVNCRRNHHGKTPVRFYATRATCGMVSSGNHDVLFFFQ